MKQPEKFSGSYKWNNPVLRKEVWANVTTLDVTLCSQSSTCAPAGRVTARGRAKNARNAPE